MDAPSALSCHRLPPLYRRGLPVCALLLPALLLLTLLIATGPSPMLLSPRLWLPLLVLCLPAAYWWQEGVDICPTGLRRRIHTRRFLPYSEVAAWRLDERAGVLRVFDQAHEVLLECRPAHLTCFDRLLVALRQHAPEAELPAPTAPPEPSAAPPR